MGKNNRANGRSTGVLETADWEGSGTRVLNLPQVRVLRLTQLVKNTVVLAPLLFSRSFLQADLVLNAVSAAVCFCFASAAVYVMNDLHDRWEDRGDKVKVKTRPLASGELRVGDARAIAALLLLVVWIWLALTPNLRAGVLGYVVLNLAYTWRLKDCVFLDIVAIAAGFVLRVYAGAAAIDVKLSGWMFTATLCGALFMAAMKRRAELANGGQRRTLERYSARVLNMIAASAAAAGMGSYTAFSFLVRPALAPSSMLVGVAMWRYFLLARNGRGEWPVETVLGDRPLLACTAAWLAWCVAGVWVSD